MINIRRLVRFVQFSDVLVALASAIASVVLYIVL